MKITVKGKGLKVSLSKNDFIAKGGEGEIYAKGKTVYKICEPGKMIPEGKFTELSVLRDKHIVKPEDILLDEKGKSVGYTMQYIPDTYTLCQLFTKAFRDRNNIGHEAVIGLVRQMQEVIAGIHQRSILLVDLNELNFLLSKDFKDVWFIDVNSYQTPSYRATAIMDSIRDRHCKNVFTEGTDWFSFGIVSFQMMIGIHPYKGKHPSFTDPRTALDDRMKGNVSIFNPKVRYPKGACQPIDILPEVYKKWYEALFEKGMRLPPPKDLIEKIGIIQTVRHIAGSHNFEISELQNYVDRVVAYYSRGQKEVVVTNRSVYVYDKPMTLPAPSIRMGFSPITDRPIAGHLSNGKIVLHDFYRQSDLAFTLEAQNIMDYDGRIYAQSGTNLVEILLNEMGSNIYPTSHVVGYCMERATSFFDGVVIQNVFGSYFASCFPESKQCRQLTLGDMGNQRIVDAKFLRGVMVVVCMNKEGVYSRHIYRLGDQLELMQSDEDVVYAGINFTVLDNGVCILMTEDEKIMIFRNDVNASGVKIIDDDEVKGDMKLISKGAKAMFMKETKVYSIKSK